MSCAKAVASPSSNEASLLTFVNGVDWAEWRQDSVMTALASPVLPDCLEAVCLQYRRRFSSEDITIVL